MKTFTPDDARAQAAEVGFCLMEDWLLFVDWDVFWMSGYDYRVWMDFCIAEFVTLSDKHCVVNSEGGGSSVWVSSEFGAGVSGIAINLSPNRSDEDLILASFLLLPSTRVSIDNFTKALPK